MRTWTGRLLVGLGVVVLVLLGAQGVRVHRSTGEFRLTPAEAPPKLHEGGRDYVRSASTPGRALPKDTQEIGETPGGGEIFGPRHVVTPDIGKDTVNPTVIWVRDDDGQVWSYALVGGP